MKIKAHIVLLIALLGTIFLIVPITPSYACPSCKVRAGGESTDQWEKTTEHIDTEFEMHKMKIIEDFWKQNVLPAMMGMADQLSAVAMQQVQIVGSFLDAKHQLETQRVLEGIQASAQKDYHPSVGLCEFGSSMKSLAASERKAEYTAIVLSQRSMDRQLGAANTSATYGALFDKGNRLRQFAKKFCDTRDNNNNLNLLCINRESDQASGEEKEKKRARHNKDIDFGRTVDHPWSLDIDFTDPEVTDEEEEVMAMAANLYSHDLFVRLGSDLLELKGDIKEPQRKYLDMRALTAKRNVAENSFNAITSMKSHGTGASKEFLDALLQELGVEGEELEALMGKDPSYYAQMEVLTKKIYQNPDFYTNLYDKPTNVARKEVALQAIALMQKFDLFKSYLRSEASLSVLLELAVIDLQNEIELQTSAPP